MRIRIFALLLIPTLLLAFSQPQIQKIYIPFVHRPPVAKINCTGQIVVTVFEDTNADSQRAEQEPGIAGVSVTLRSYDYQTVTQLRTDGDGRTAMIVMPGSYEVRAQSPEGYRWTTPYVWGVDIVCANVRINMGLAPAAQPTADATQ